MSRGVGWAIIADVAGESNKWREARVKGAERRAADGRSATEVSCEAQTQRMPRGSVNSRVLSGAAVKFLIDAWLPRRQIPRLPRDWA